MSAERLTQVAREAGGRIVAALAARFRNLDIAEDAYAEACAKALATWPAQGEPENAAAWLYRVAERSALDALRRENTRRRFLPEPPLPEPTAEEMLTDDATLIPDERLRLIFVCCHPAVGGEARAALTLRTVCGLTTAEIARAFLVSEATLAQRLVRAKRKIAEAGISFEVPGPEQWPGRLDAVLSTLEIAYAKAHEDAAGVGAHAGYASEILALTRVLATLLPEEPEVLAFAALVRYAEARRPARLDEIGAMVPLSEQDPLLWDTRLIEAGNRYLGRVSTLQSLRPRVVQAMIHGIWCARASLDEPPPWPQVLALYESLLLTRDDAFVRLNRAVALAEISGPAAALEEVEALHSAAMQDYLSFHAVRADLLRRLHRWEAARAAYDAALQLEPAPAERLWLERRRQSLP